MTRSRVGRRASLLLWGLALLLVAVGGAQLLQSTPGADADPGSAGTAAPRPGVVVRSAPALPREQRVAWRPGAPRRVVVPTLGIDAAVVPVGAPGGTLVPPADASRLGWWAGGAPVGSRRGATLVAGHTVHTGGGAFDDLEDARPGDRVVVQTGDRRFDYRVVGVSTLSKGEVDRDARRLFAQDGPGRLVLVTCEDWNGSGYDSNVVVTARPVRERAE